MGVDRRAGSLGILGFSSSKVESRPVTLTKLDVASRQLDTAIHLFLEGDYLSSLTLAGAAEEILGALCKRAGKIVSTEAVAAFHFADTDPALTDEARRSVLFNVMNFPRNEAKHANDPAETHFVVERTFPLQMIMRAMPMARALGSPPLREAEMVAWIRAHPEATQSKGNPT